MRIAFIGCVEFSHSALDHLLGLPAAEVVGVVTRAAAPNSDFRSLAPLAESADIPVFLADAGDQEQMASWLRARGADVVYCFGWSFLLRREVLSAAPLGVIGFHPTALPANRGRHPLIWALALGLEETASSFFVMDEGADTGDLVSQVPVVIKPEDDAASLYARVTRAALGQISDITAALAAGNLERRPQSPGGNVWRKRGVTDGCIDWRMSATSIHNLVRALTRPYPGAHCVHQGRQVKVWRTAIIDAPEHNIEPGKVLASSEGDRVIVKCDGGAIALLEHGFEDLPAEGEYL